ncbi:MAG: hypothetical protein ABWW69_03290 [Pyrodictiaceae archaeon]
MRLLIVFHEPGKDVGYRVAKVFTSKLEKILQGVSVVPTYLGRLKNDIREGDYVFAALLTRGRHYQHVVEISRNNDATFLGKIPNHLVVNSLIYWAQYAKCKRMVIYHRRSSKITYEQDEDLEEVASMITSKLRRRVLCCIVESERAPIFSNDCIVGYTVLPNSFMDEVMKRYKRHRPKVLNYLLPVLTDGLVRVISERLSKAMYDFESSTVGLLS